MNGELQSSVVEEHVVTMELLAHERDIMTRELKLLRDGIAVAGKPVASPSVYRGMTERLLRVYDPE